MPEETNQTSAATGYQPVNRAAAAMPLQRSNYGIPPRQAAQPVSTPPATPPTPANPGQVMDFAPRRPVTPPAPAMPASPVAPQPVVAQPAVPAPAPAVQPPTVGIPTPAAAPITPRQPLFAATPPAPVAPKQPGKFKRVLHKLHWPLLIGGVLLLLGGGARFVTAGNISGYTVAVAAVVVNDGHKMIMQFTADDGKLHRFTVNRSSAKLIPGNSVEVAYRPGAADATVKQVSVVNNGRHSGILLILLGVIFLVAGGFQWLLTFSRRPKTASAPSQAVPVNL